MKTLEPKTEPHLKQQWIERWGDFSAEIMLDADYQCFTIPEVEGAILFKVELGCAVTFGDPLCSKEDAFKLAEAFRDHCEKNNWNTLYLLATEWFSKWALENVCQAMIEIGDELVFDTKYDPLGGPRNKLRNKVNHAQHIGLAVHEYISGDPDLEKQIQAVGNEWLKGRSGPQIYLADVDFFEKRENRRWFYVQGPEGLVGTALLTRIEKRQGWYLKFLIVLPDAPRGSSEFMMTTILETLYHEGCRMLTYGMVPGSSLGEVVGVGKLSLWFARCAFSLARKFFNLEGRKAYWGQFLPLPERIFLLFGKPKIGIKELRVVLKALKVEF